MDVTGRGAQRRRSCRDRIAAASWCVQRLRNLRLDSEVALIGAALALIVLGVILVFLVPWVGIPLGIVGLVLVVLFLAGVGRRATEGRP
jgi:hypothetical protein